MDGGQTLSAVNLQYLCPTLSRPAGPTSGDGYTRQGDAMKQCRTTVNPDRHLHSNVSHWVLFLAQQTLSE
jgi:hypothetical protein